MRWPLYVGIHYFRNNISTCHPTRICTTRFGGNVPSTICSLLLIPVTMSVLTSAVIALVIISLVVFILFVVSVRIPSRLMEIAPVLFFALISAQLCIAVVAVLVIAVSSHKRWKPFYRSVSPWRSIMFRLIPVSVTEMEIHAIDVYQVK